MEQVRRRPAAVIVLVLVVLGLGVGAAVLAARVALSPVDRVTLEDQAAAAAQQNAVERRDEWREALAEGRHDSDQAFESAAEAFVDRERGDVVIESGDGRLTWRTYVLGDAHNDAGGFLARSSSAVLCFDATADKDAEELVVLADAGCPPDVEALGDVDVDLAP